MKRTKYNLKALLAKAHQMVEGVGIPLTPLAHITLKTSDSRRRWGYCSRQKNNNNFIIGISNKTILLGSDAVLQVLVHELLHTVDGCFNHGAKWKMHASIINKNYGMNVSRVNSAEDMCEKEVANAIMEADKKAAKYRIYCPTCGQEIFRFRKCKLVSLVDFYKCGKCMGKLKLEVRK
ncbi:MAG TPA: SprT-like domain-containing protein [Anaerovoracaceae bacterium]|nr:SprT-like domain-containing protein [Anaerovoracaceae bacterium]